MPHKSKLETVASLPNVVIILVSLWFAWRLWSLSRRGLALRTVAVVVLGDIGRSPRVMYHAQSFAENGFLTYVIGYGGSKPIPSLERQSKVQIRHLSELPKFWAVLPFILYGPIKNPPTIPTLAVIWLVGKITGSKVIIDWHNLGYSILALRLGNEHPFVKIAIWFEATFGRTAYVHLFVTDTMKDYLEQKWSLQGYKLVLHDRPPHHFHRSSSQEIHEVRDQLFFRLKPFLTLQTSLHDFLPESSIPYSTPFTHTVSERQPTSAVSSTAGSAARRNSIEYRAKISPTNPPLSVTALYPEVQLPSRRPDRPALLVTSTSWTPDEDFGILLEAMQIYEMRARELSGTCRKVGDTKEEPSRTASLPKLLVIITGKGPLREKYMNDVTKVQEKWEWVRCVSLWLEAEDYPTLLGSADLGVSLHSSSSALDLPMKVVDMFGCGLPVCALDFACLHELVKDGLNGRVFKTSSQLAEQLENLLTGFPETPRLNDLRASLLRTSKRRSTPSHAQRQSLDIDDQEWRWGTWDENWNLLVKPLIISNLNHGHG
ncbi:hypothetical protein C0992_002137 [Termitomyces sp. T32_za158]|nr:hypothetical protein C0992_002137 [Termitomyces sp. T32_za158]